MTERRSPFSERWIEREAFAEMSAELSTERHFLLSAALSLAYKECEFSNFLAYRNCQNNTKIINWIEHQYFRNLSAELSAELSDKRTFLLNDSCSAQLEIIDLENIEIF